MSLLIYIAGFDVFCSDAKRIGEDIKRYCRNLGFEGLFPLDVEIGEHLESYDSKDRIADVIYKGNIDKIKKSHVVMANLNPFRSVVEPDSGTCFELGVGYACEKYLYGYLDDNRDMLNKLGKSEEDPWDENGYNIEDFGLSVNLMIALSTNIVEGTYKNCLDRIKEDYDKGLLEVKKGVVEYENSCYRD